MVLWLAPQKKRLPKEPLFIGRAVDGDTIIDTVSGDR
jgi:hypothetical protein